MFGIQFTTLYAIAIMWSTGFVLTLGWYFYKNISYRLALGTIGWKPPLQWQDWLSIVVDTISIIITWPLTACRFIRDERARRRPIPSA